MSDFNPTRAAELAGLLEECDEKATQAPYGVIEQPQGKGRREFIVNDANGMWVAECDGAEHDAHSIASLRNAARETAEQLRVAIAEVVSLKAKVEGHRCNAANAQEQFYALERERDALTCERDELRKEVERMRDALIAVRKRTGTNLFDSRVDLGAMRMIIDSALLATKDQP